MNDPKVTFAQRLAAAVEKAGGARSVSNASGVPISTLHTYLSGSAEPKLGVVVRLAETLGATIGYLAGTESRSDFPASENMDDSVSLPVLNVVGSAGGGITADDERVISRLPFSKTLLRELGVRPENCHFIRAKGDSMEPTIGDGAVVLIDTSRRKDREDGVYALMAGDDVRIKRLQFATFGGLTLMSDNPAYPDETFGRGEIDQIKIVGKVVWVGSGL